MRSQISSDDQEAAEAIRGAMRQIEDRVAAKVRDKWLAKIGKKPANAQSEPGTSGKEKEAVTDDKQGGKRNFLARWFLFFYKSM